MNLKNIVYSSVFFCITLLVGCSDDFLDRYPSDSFSNKTFWKNQEEAKMALNGCYNGFESYWNILWFDAGSDNARNPFGYNGFPVIGRGDHNPFDVGRDFFGYGAIRKYNEFIENIENVTMDAELKAQYKAEVIVLRAYDYFRKTQLYGDVPLVTELLTPEEAADYERVPKAEVVAFILKDLDDAAKVLPKEEPQVGRITKGFALGLKARIELFNEMWAEAAISAKAVMDLNQYSLFSNYEELFHRANENNSEVVMDVQYIKDTYSEWTWQHLMPHGEGGWSAISPLQALVDAYECVDGKTIEESTLYDPENPHANRDPRLGFTIICPGDPYNGRFMDPYSAIDQYTGGANADYYVKWAQTGASSTGYHLRKYMDPAVQPDELQNSDINVIVMRYAEVLLTYAEAMYKSNKLTQDILDLTVNVLRERAYVQSAGLDSYPRVLVSDPNMEQLLRRERRVELAMEGMRWYDIQRWRIADKVMPGKVYGARIGTVDFTNGKVTFSGEEHIFVEERRFDASKNYLWPIAQSYIDNSQGKITPNPNY